MTWRVPSPELAARIQQWIDETESTPSLENGPLVFFKEQNALLVSGNQAFLWALRPSGEIIRIDTDQFRRDVEPETDPRYVFMILMSAAEKGCPELRELVPEQPGDVRRCECGGTGVRPERSDPCLCGGLGWFIYYGVT